MPEGPEVSRMIDILRPKFKSKILQLKVDDIYNMDDGKHFTIIYLLLL